MHTHMMIHIDIIIISNICKNSKLFVFIFLGGGGVLFVEFLGEK